MNGHRYPGTKALIFYCLDCAAKHKLGEGLPLASDIDIPCHGCDDNLAVMTRSATDSEEAHREAFTGPFAAPSTLKLKKECEEWEWEFRASVLATKWYRASAVQIGEF